VDGADASTDVEQRRPLDSLRSDDLDELTRPRVQPAAPPGLQVRLGVQAVAADEGAVGVAAEPAGLPI
jgi:hypothetical protein